MKLWPNQGWGSEGGGAGGQVGSLLFGDQVDIKLSFRSGGGK